MPDFKNKAKEFGSAAKSKMKSAGEAILRVIRILKGKIVELVRTIAQKIRERRLKKLPSIVKVNSAAVDEFIAIVKDNKIAKGTVTKQLDMAFEGADRDRDMSISSLASTVSKVLKNTLNDLNKVEGEVAKTKGEVSQEQKDSVEDAKNRFSACMKMYKHIMGAPKSEGSKEKGDKEAQYYANKSLAKEKLARKNAAK